MKKVINIALDLETLSRRTSAAIIGIAAKAFSLGENKVKEDAYFFQSVDATSCAMLGFDIDQSTVEWWAQKPDKVKKQFSCNRSIRWALSDLCEFVNKVKTDNDADTVCVWCQGTDFDIAVIRNAFVVANKDQAEKYYSVEIHRCKGQPNFHIRGSTLALSCRGRSLLGYSKE